MIFSPDVTKALHEDYEYVAFHPLISLQESSITSLKKHSVCSIVWQI